MVVRSGDESIVRYDRERVRGYYIGGSVLSLMAVMIVVLSLDDAAGQSGWGHRIIVFASSAWYAVIGAFLALKVYKAGRAFSQAFVAIRPDGVRLHLLRKKGLTCVLLPEQRFKWEDIGDITCNGGSCRFRVGGHVHTLSNDNSPSPPTVAQLMAERKGVKLPVQESLVPPRKTPMPRLTQAAIMGGISLPMMGIVVAGGLWMYRHDHGPYYEAEFGALALIGLVGGILFLIAITLTVVEMNHRL
ncbi:MAG TPA: hypothetical protein VH325_11615 [Bryobacteraceae bacterium]|nr:hypothetical protein [Bryobacteraceae bacterium]